MWRLVCVMCHYLAQLGSQLEGRDFAAWGIAARGVGKCACNSERVVLVVIDSITPARGTHYGPEFAS